MGGCRCSYKSCKSATKTTENLHFFHYPVKDKERCAVWIKNADKPQYATLPTDQLRNKVVCGLHFLDKYFANVQKRRLVHNAIPTLDVGCDSIPDDLSYIKEVEILPTSTDGTTFTLHAEHLQPGPSAAKIEKTEFQNGNMIIPVDDIQSEEVYTIDPSYIKQTVFDFNTNNVKDVISLSHEPQILHASSLTNTENEEDCMMIYDSNDSSKVSAAGENDKNKAHLLFAEETRNQNDFDGEVARPMIKRAKVVVDSARKENSISTAPVMVVNNATSIRLSNRSVIRSLKGKVPDSVLGLLSMHLHKRQTVLGKEEESYAKVLYDLPSSSKLILKKHGWYVPT